MVRGKKTKTKNKGKTKKKGIIDKLFGSKDRAIDFFTKLLVISIIVLSIGIYIVGKYENRIGTYLIVVSSFVLYITLITVAIII